MCGERGILPGSIKNYLFSLIDFCTFLLTTKTVISGVPTDNIYQAKLNIELWRKSYRSYRIRKHQRAEEDFQMLITSEQINMYKKSQNGIEASNLKNELEENPDLAEFTCFRDHLLFIIHFGTAHRSGVTANMTMGEIRRAREIADGVITISVWDHKTSEHYGPARGNF